MKKLPDTVTISVQRKEEEWQVYFLATSKNIDGFYAVWETMEEAIQSAKDVLSDMYKREKTITFGDLYIDRKIKEMLALRK